MPFYLLKKEPIAEGLRRIAHEQIDIALNNFQDGSMPQHRQVHALRARCKKLRGLLRLVQLPMGEAFYTEDQQFRTAGKALAEHREQEVIAKTIRSLDDSNSYPDFAPIQIPPDTIEHSLAILTACKGTVDQWPLNIHGFADIAPGFSRTYRKCLHAYDNILRDRDDAHFHHLRKWAKYHWYQVRILERLNKTEIRKQRNRLRKLHLALGEAHDLAVAQTVLGPPDYPDKQLLQRALDRKNALYADAIRLCKKIFTQSTDELVADYAHWWVASVS
jgi:CHAD domain-containing protein